MLGRGRVGRSLHEAITATGREVTLAAGRSASAVEPGPDLLVILAVPDPAVAAVAAELPPAAGAAAVHVAGALGLAPLDAARDGGWEVGSLHPLQPFPVARDPSAFRGITMAVDATSPDLAAGLEALARDLGAEPRRVPDSDRRLYHAAAVVASGFVVALVATAADLLAQTGWSREEAVSALLPLVRGAAGTLGDLGLPNAMTGPFARGDSETIAGHLEAIAAAPDAHDLDARVYRIVGRVALELAREAGLDEEAARRIEEALTG